MTQEEIERGFVGAGWEMCHSSEHLLVAGFGDLSLLAYGPFVGIGDPKFELFDFKRCVTYWVREIPTPRQARVLLEQHGEPPEKEQSKPLQTG